MTEPTPARAATQNRAASATAAAVLTLVTALWPLAFGALMAVGGVAGFVQGGMAVLIAPLYLLIAAIAISVGVMVALSGRKLLRTRSGATSATVWVALAVILSIVVGAYLLSTIGDLAAAGSGVDPTLAVVLAGAAPTFLTGVTAIVLVQATRRG